MSTITPPSELSPEDRELNERYLGLLQHYDACAVRSKRWMLTLWHVSMFLTWLPLLLAIAALAQGQAEGFSHALVVNILRGAGFANAVVTIAQLVFLFRNRWLKYRAATERLRENCMRFRARLNVFGDDNAVQHFRGALDELEQEVGGRRPFRLWDRIPLPYLAGVKRLPRKLRDPLDHSPDKGLYPRCDTPEAAETIVLVERLRSQQRWHLRKARLYSRLYLALQIGIVFLGLASAAARLLNRLMGGGHDHTLLLLALFSTATMCLIAYRERLGHAQLCLRYTRIVETLEQIERDYNQRTAGQGGSAAQRLEWLRQTADHVERALASEFQYWYFGRENFATVTAR